MVRTVTTLLPGEGGTSGSLGLVPSGRRFVKRIPANLLALVPKPTDNVDVVKGSNPDPVRDTVPLIKKLVKRQLWQGKKLAQELKGNSVTETARNFWNFIFSYVQYKEDGTDEVIKSLRKLIHSGEGDCDCFTTALSNLLLNTSIPHFLRVAAYNGNTDFSHIYIVIPKNKNMATDASGNMKETEYITLDCVPHQFNYEVPFTKHKDFAMRLVALDGLDCACGCKPSGTGSKNPPVKKILLPSKQIAQMGYVATREVLDKAGIVNTTDGNLQVVAETPEGSRVKLPEYIPMSMTEKLVSDIKTYKPSAATPSTTTEQSAAQSSTQHTQTPTAVKAGGALLGLLALSMAVGSLRSDPTGKSLSGTPARSKNRMGVLHM